MNCLVTAGPTFENLDQVRRLTNFSTGQLGSELAGFLSQHGHSVILLKGYYAVWHEPVPGAAVQTFTTTADLSQRIRSLAGPSIDAVFHAAAVSDFTFGRVFARTASGELEPVNVGKLSTRRGALLAELVPTPKLIAELRDLFPNAYLVGWKYEVDGSREDALQAGLDQLQRCRTNTCVVNGPAYGDGFGIVTVPDERVHLSAKPDLFQWLGSDATPSRD